MDLSLYIFITGIILLVFILLFYQKKKNVPFSNNKNAEKRKPASLPQEALPMDSVEKILQFITYFETLSLKNHARRFMLTASSFEIMLYHEALGDIYRKYEHQLEEGIISAPLLHETYLGRMKQYLGGEKGLIYFHSLSVQIRLIDQDVTTPALYIPLYCAIEQQEHVISQIAEQYEKRYQRQLPYKIFHSSDTFS